MVRSQSSNNEDIARMNNRLMSLEAEFRSKTQEFTHQINLHEGRLDENDLADFEELINEIRETAMKRIKHFIDERLKLKSEIYDESINSYTQSHLSVQNQLKHFAKDLEQQTIALKEEQSKKEVVLEHFSKKFSRNTLLKKSFKAMNDYRKERQQEKETDKRMDDIYQRNLKKKAFFPWRTLTYKQGYENTVRRQTQTDIMNIHQQYKGIIQILKTKINQTDNLIKVKKAAKGEFTYALSKNLLKTISNLSLEVMSLNQISLRDQEFANQSTEKFMGEVDQVIKQKLEKVREYKREISGENQENDGQRKKKITFL